MREIVVQHFAVTLAYRTLKREQFLGEPSKDFQRRLFVVQEHIAPHRWITRGDPREITETSGRILYNFTIGYAA